MRNSLSAETINYMTAHVEQRTKDYDEAMAREGALVSAWTWSAWRPFDEAPETARAVVSFLLSTGELDGALTLADYAGLDYKQYRLAPIVRSQFLEHPELRQAPLSDLD